MRQTRHDHNFLYYLTKFTINPNIKQNQLGGTMKTHPKKPFFEKIISFLLFIILSDKTENDESNSDDEKYNSFEKILNWGQRKVH